METALILANTTEFNYRSFLDGSGECAPRIAAEAGISSTFESAIFWGAEQQTKLVVAPEPINEHLLAYAREVLAIDISCLVPPSAGIAVAARAAHSGSFIKELGEMVGGGSIRVLAWGPTKWSASLVSAFQRSRPDPVNDEYSAENGWVLADHLNSKAVNRAVLAQAFGSTSQIRFPSYLTVLGRPVVESIANHVRSLADGAVLKPLSGWGGKASLALDRAAVSSRSLQLRRVIAAHLRCFSKYYDMGLVIDEKITGPRARILSVDVYIHSQENISAWPSLTHMDGLNCIGEDVGIGVISPSLERPLQLAGMEVGRLLATFGYKGWLDIDFLQVGGKLYALEINARRTGGTVPIEVATRLHGHNWMKQCVIRSIDKFKVKQGVSPSDITEYFHELSSKSHFRNVVLPVTLRGLTTSTKRRRPISYLVCATTRRECLAIDSLIRMKLGTAST